MRSANIVMPRPTGALGLCLAAALGCNGSIAGSRTDATGGGSGAVVETGGAGAQTNAAQSGAGAGTTGSAAPAGSGGRLAAAAEAGQSAPAGAAGAAGTTAVAGTAGANPSPDKPRALINPAPGSSLFMGVNFWNIDWEGTDNYFASDVNWAATSDPWNAQFLKDLAPYHALRFMDWNLINESDNPQAEWSSRPPQTIMPDEGVAFEWQIDLCNRTLKDYWLNIPHAATEDYVTKLANLVREKLDPQLRVYVEWSNEVWNGSFPQRDYALQQGEMLALPGDDKAASYQVYRSVRIFEAFAAAFGADSARVVNVLSGQAAWTGPCEAQLKALSDTEINPNKTQPTVYAVAPYVSGESIAELTNEGISKAAGWIEDSVQCADSAGLPLIAYEGGQDSYSLGESGCAELQGDPGMRKVYVQFLDALMQAKLKGPFMHYTHSGNCWGLKRKTSDSAMDSPKYQGMLDWQSKQP